MHVRQDAYGNPSLAQYYKQNNENFLYYDPAECRFVVYFNSTLKTGAPVVGYIRRDEQLELFEALYAWIHSGRTILLSKFAPQVCLFPYGDSGAW
jgi:hypothetical protein